MSLIENEKRTDRGRSQDGGGIGREDHFLFYKFIERTTERGTETRPGKGISIEEVSNNQETLALAGPGEIFRSRRAT